MTQNEDNASDTFDEIFLIHHYYNICKNICEKMEENEKKEIYLNDDFARYDIIILIEILNGNKKIKLTKEQKNWYREQIILRGFMKGLGVEDDTK